MVFLTLAVRNRNEPWVACLLLPPLLQARTSSPRGSASECIANRSPKALWMCQILRITSLMARTAWCGAGSGGSAASSWLRGKVGAGSTGRRQEGAGVGVVGQPVRERCVK